MQKSYECGSATHIGPESCGAVRKNSVDRRTSLDVPTRPKATAALVSDRAGLWLATFCGVAVSPSSVWFLRAYSFPILHVRIHLAREPGGWPVFPTAVARKRGTQPLCPLTRPYRARVDKIEVLSSSTAVQRRLGRVVHASGCSDVASLLHGTHPRPALRVREVDLLLSSRVPTGLRCPLPVRCATNLVADVEVVAQPNANSQTGTTMLNICEGK